jgi:hypothetical protein
MPGPLYDVYVISRSRDEKLVFSMFDSNCYKPLFELEMMIGERVMRFSDVGDVLKWHIKNEKEAGRYYFSDPNGHFIMILFNNDGSMVYGISPQVCKCEGDLKNDPIAIHLLADLKKLTGLEYGYVTVEEAAEDTWDEFILRSW